MAITLQVLMSCCFSLVETSTGTSFTLNNCFEDIIILYTRQRRGRFGGFPKNARNHAPFDSIILLHYNNVRALHDEFQNV